MSATGLHIDFLPAAVDLGVNGCSQRLTRATVAEALTFGCGD